MPDDPRTRPDDDASRPGDAPPAAAEGTVPAGDGPGAAPVPDESELVRTAVPATVRRAPRYRAFVVAGALVGVVVGVVLALATAGSSTVVNDGGVLPFLGGQNGVRWLMALAGALLGGLVGGAAALVADRRSTRRAHPAPRD